MTLLQDNTNLQEVNNLSKMDAALWYARVLGISVFPVAENGKTPLVNWRTEATTDPFLIEMTWLTWPEANIGLAMGGPDGWLAVDLDLHHGQQGAILECMRGQVYTYGHMGLVRRQPFEEIENVLHYPKVDLVNQPHAFGDFDEIQGLEYFVVFAAHAD